MVITINPIVFGNFRKRTFRNPKAAERKTSIVVIRKKSILILGLSQFEIDGPKVIISSIFQFTTNLILTKYPILSKLPQGKATKH